MKGFERLGASLFNLSESDADYMFGEMNINIIETAFYDLLEDSNRTVFDSARALWRQCIEIAATRAGINDSSKIEIDDFEECANTFYNLTGFELEEVEKE